MSEDSFDDSFDSASGCSDQEEEAIPDQRVLQTTGLTGNPRPVSMFGGNIPPPSFYSKKDHFLPVKAKEAESYDDMRFKEERSPKPKKKFGTNFGSNLGSTLRKSAIGSIRRPNMANFRQKIKSKLRRDQPIFGAPLEAAIQRSLLGTDGIELPTVFRECISFLEDKGLEQEGLYRLPGVKSKIEEAKSRYDRGEIVDLDDYDPNVVASLLKLYLRELPDPLLSPLTTMKFEALSGAGLPPEEQTMAFLDELAEVPVPNKLMLGWLMEHMSHIIKHSSVNKMSLPNLVIVFSPTLQLSAPILHALYNNAQDIFGSIELAKYEKPEKKPGRLKLPNLKEAEELTTEEEISAELDKLTAVLEKLHAKMAGKYDDKNDYFWELQRTITDLRRKKKNLQRKTVPDVMASSNMAMAGGEEEFVRTLVLMEATLTAENEELLAKKEKLQAAIREETELIESYKKRLQEQRARLNPAESDEELDQNGVDDDENELAKKVAELRWHEKELELRNKNLVKSIKEEEDEIMQLKVKLKVLPLKQKLNVDE